MTIRKTLLFLGTGLLLLLLIASLTLAVYRYRHYQRTLLLHSPYGNVSIHWDKTGIPHIQAHTKDTAAFYGLGYAHANDRLWQMELQRLTAQGRLSEIFGQRTLKKDQYLRSWRFCQAAQQDWQHYDKMSRQFITSYVQGINDAIAQQGLSLPFYLLGHHPQAWSEIDALCWQKMMAWDLESTWKKKIGRALAHQTDNHATPLIHAKSSFHKSNSRFRDFTGKGSNSWVVSGQLTTTGQPILANDIHLALTTPSLVYLAELQGPHLYVSGATLAGLPSVVIGHNRFIAWGLTNSYVDTQDLFISKQEQLQAHDNIIQIKGKPAQHYTTYTSSKGPVISQVTHANRIAPWIAIRWPALSGHDTTIASFLHLGYAKNWKQFKEALRSYVAPVQNILYADKQGHIGYYMPGKIPIRHGFDGSVPVPDDAQHTWQGYIPFAQLPQRFDPASGIIVTANNRVADTHYPYLLTSHGYMPPYRAQRIYTMLKQHQHLSMQDHKAIQIDIKSSVWPLFKPMLLAIKPSNQQQQQALQYLQSWSGDMSTNSIAASLFAAWYQEIDKVIEEPLAETEHTEDPFFVQQQLLHNSAACHIKTIRSCQELIVTSFKQALNILTQRLGSTMSSWTWGRLHRLNFSDKIFSQSPWLAWIWSRNIATPGSKYTVNLGTYDHDFQQIGGAAYRQIIDLSDFNNNLYMIPLGQNENPLNPHYADLLHPWQYGEYLKIPMH